MSNKRSADPLKQPETALVYACLDLLRVVGVRPLWRQNGGGMKVDDRFIRFASIDGISDCMGMIPRQVSEKYGGKLIVVECKIGDNKPTADQMEFLQAVADGGGVAMVVYSIDELMDGLRQVGLLPAAGPAVPMEG